MQRKMEVHQIALKFMSGRDDGDSRRLFAHRGDGAIHDERWIIRIGRDDDCDMTIKDDYISRVHARLYHTNVGWWLEDSDSRNGTFVTPVEDFFREERLIKSKPVALEVGQLFRCGHTWLRLELINE